MAAIQETHMAAAWVAARAAYAAARAARTAADDAADEARAAYRWPCAYADDAYDAYYAARCRWYAAARATERM